MPQVQAGDNCARLSLAYSLTLEDFFFLNPEVYSNCTNLLLGVAYCVFPVGDIATYSGYEAPPTLAITVPPATFSSVNTAIPTATNHPDPDFEITYLPKAPDTLEDCADYANYLENATDPEVNSCETITYAYSVSFSDLLDWNPSLAQDEADCALQPGYSYCVAKNQRSTEWVPDGDQCIPVDSSEIQDGTDPRCVCFTDYTGNDVANGLDCESVAKDASIKLKQLKAWNPWLESDCDPALAHGLDDGDYRAVCIGINATAETASATKPASTATLPASTKSSASMGKHRVCSPRQE